MIQKFLKSLPISIVLMLMVNSANACVHWDDPTTKYFSYFYGSDFYPEGYDVVSRFVSQKEYYGPINAWFPVRNEVDVNIELWHAYLGYSPQQIRDLIYHIDEKDLLKALKGNYDGDISILNDIVASSKMAVVKYLIFARSCEDFCNFAPKYYWQETEDDKSSQQYNDKIVEGQKLYGKCKDPFLKLRYGYQLIKLLRYDERFEECVDFYNQMIKECGEENPVKYWGLAQVAGCQKNLGRESESHYNFLKVFMNCPSRRVVVFRSNNIKTQVQWDSLMNMCSRDEKIAMHYMRAQEVNANKLEEARYIFSLDSNCDYLPFLVTAHIKELERLALSSWKFSDMPFFKNRGQGRRDTSQKEVMATLKFVDDVIEDDKSVHLPLFKYAGVYLELLLGNGEGAGERLQNISPKVRRSFARQDQTMQAMIYLQGVEEPTLADEDKMKEFYSYIPELVRTFFASTYTPDNEMRYMLSHSEFTALRGSSDATLIKNIIDWEKRAVNESWYVNKVLRPRFFRYLPKVNISLEDEQYRLLFLKELLGTVYLNSGEYDEALKVFSELSPEFCDKYVAFGVYGNPFNFSIRDFDFPSSHKRYTKLDLARTLSVIQNKIDRREATAMDWFLKANAYQNTSYYGRLWQLKFYFRSTVEVSGPHDFLLVARNYEHAAHMSDDREFQARCYFLAAKARNSQFFVDNPYTNLGRGAYKMYDGELGVEQVLGKMEKQDALRYYKILRRDYHDTEFYQQVVKECKVFSFYCNNF